MIYLYRRKVSESARELADNMTVNCRRINDLARAHFGAGVRNGDVVICWGDNVTNLPNGVRTLNNAPLRNKMEDARLLREAGIQTVEVSQTRPATVSGDDPAILQYRTLVQATPQVLDRAAIQRVVDSLRLSLAQPIPVAATWLPRRFNHVGGADLLRAPAQPDYFSKKIDLVEEYRIHSFKGKSIRAGVKVPRDGATPHAWIRSFDGGWRIKYDEFKSKESMREIAAAAVEALGLDFGAVDIGRKADKSLVVLEVNRAPGLEGGTTVTYANAIQAWIEGRE